jgi:hypothetical protein
MKNFLGVLETAEKSVRHKTQTITQNNRERMKIPVVLFLVGVLVGALACYGYLLSINQPSNREKAYNYLVNSYNSTLGLCFDYPGSNTYWVSHDNVLASYVLQHWNAVIADNMTTTIIRIMQEYDLSAAEVGLPLDWKMEALMGYDVNFSRNTEQPFLNNSYYGSVLRTERTNITSYLNFTNYADTLCYASLVEWRRQNYPEAYNYYNEAKAMWDGNGFRDDAFHNVTGVYATFKLGLFYLTSRTESKDFDFKQDLIERVLQNQDNDTGGFFTDYYSNGSHPLGSTTNTETTSIILLADV